MTVVDVSVLDSVRSAAGRAADLGPVSLWELSERTTEIRYP